jgi:hypothetical protein
MSFEDIKLTVDDFGFVEDHITKEQKQVKRFTWTNEKKKVSIQVKTVKKKLFKNN